MARIKLPGLSFNNLRFGPEAANAKAMPTPKAAAGAANLTTRIYIAQNNFVDTLPSPLVALPGQPTDYPPSPPAYYVDVTVAEGDSLLTALQAVPTTPISLWTSATIAGGALSQFTRSNASYESIGSYNPPMPAPPTPPDPGVYQWTGWGIMYYPGIFRPSRFEQYPSLSIAQMPVYSFSNVFTIDYAKTQITFEITANNELHIINGEIL